MVDWLVGRMVDEKVVMMAVLMVEPLAALLVA